MLEYKEMLEKPHFSKVARVIGINGLVVLVIIFAPAVIFEVYKLNSHPRDEKVVPWMVMFLCLLRL